MSSIGIIGGADGPTVVLLSGNPWLEIAVGVLLLAAIVVLIVLLRKKKLPRSPFRPNVSDAPQDFPAKHEKKD